MKPPHTALKLPRYCRRKAKATEGWSEAYFFEPPTRAGKQGCYIQAEAFGEEYAAAVDRAEKILLPAFDGWRSTGLTVAGSPRFSWERLV
jgi:hypothetical protein